ncbi:MAG: Rhodanese-related sulfurtransferase [Paramarteilia canceri]
MEEEGPLKLSLTVDHARLTIVDPNVLDFDTSELHGSSVGKAQGKYYYSAPCVRFALFLIFGKQPDELELKFLEASDRAAKELIKQLNSFEKIKSKDDQTTLIKLPASKLNLPRQKPLPGQPQLTRWQQFALRRGIKPKRKKPSIVYDENKKEWVRRWGFKSGSTVDKDQIYEITEDQAKMGFNPFQDAKKKKDTRKAKNEMNQLRNLVTKEKLKEKTDQSPSERHSDRMQFLKKNKKQLKSKLQQTRLATASMGKFQETLKDESKSGKVTMRQSYTPNFGNLSSERNNLLSIARRVGRGEKSVNVGRVSAQINERENQRDKGFLKKSKKNK